MADPPQVSLLPPDAATLLHLLRENLRLLSDLAHHYELGRLFTAPEETVIRGPEDVARYLQAEMATLAQEQLRVVLLDTRHHLLGTAIVYQGGLNSVVIRLADCFREAILRGAAALILVHNHPSLDPSPSPEDLRLTLSIADAGDLLGIDVLDHVILAGERYQSLRQQRLFLPRRDSCPGPTPEPDAPRPGY